MIFIRIHLLLYRGVTKMRAKILGFSTISTKKRLKMKKSCFSSPWSCSDTPRSSGWVRWKADNLLLKFKKNPNKKYFFIMEKMYFEKIFFEFSKNIKNFSILKCFDILQNFQKIFFQNKFSP